MKRQREILFETAGSADKLIEPVPVRRSFDRNTVGPHSCSLRYEVNRVFHFIFIRLCINVFLD